MTRKERYKQWYEQLLPKEEFSMLDLGCGNQNHTIYFPYKSCTAVDLGAKYKDKVSRPNTVFVESDILKFLDNNSNKWDVVVALDVIEHLEKYKAVQLLESMILHANKLAIIKIPDGFAANAGFDGTGDILQVHRCGFSQQELEVLGFKVRRLINDRLDYKVYYDKTDTPHPKSWDNLVATWRPNGS